MKDQYPPPDDLDTSQQEDAASEVDKENIESVSPPAHFRTEMRRRSVRTSAGRQNSSIGPSSSLYVLLDDASATDNECAGQGDESHSTSSEPQDPPTDNPPDEKSRRFQCDQCSKSYAHNKDLTRHKKTSVCATTQHSDVVRNAAPSRMPTATSVAHVSVPALVKMYQCPRCKGDFSIKFSAQRHIEKACWKVCDECCASGNDNCDANKANRADKLKCSACDSKGIECTKLTETPEGDFPVEVLRMPQNAPSEDEDAQVSGHAASRKRRRFVYMSSDSKPVEVPRKKVSFSRSSFGVPPPNDDESVQSNFRPLNQTNNLNRLRGPPITDRNHGFDFEGDLHPINVGNPAIPHDMFTNNGSQTLRSSWHRNLASQQVRALLVPQPWLSEERSTIQRPMKGALSKDQPHAQSLPQSFVPQKITRANLNSQQSFRGPQHKQYDGQYGDDSQVPNHVPPRMASHGYPRSGLPTSIHTHPSGLRQASTLSNSGEYRSSSDCQFPNPQQSGDVRRYSAPGHVACDQGFHGQFPVFQRSEYFSANPASLSTPYKTPRNSLAMDYPMISADILPIAQPGWQPGWDLQQVFGHPDRVERTEDFDFDPHDIFRHVGATPFNFDSQNDYTRPAVAPSITIQGSSNPPPSSSIGVRDRRAGVQRSRRREDVQIFENDTTNHKSNGHSVGITCEANPSAMVPIASTGMTRCRPNVKINVTVTPSSLPTPTVSDPLITLKIKGLEIGATDQEEVLTTIVMRRSQKFGPILNAYCEKRGKRYLFDWNFIHRYAMPNTEDPADLSGQILEWKMTPNDFHPTKKEPHRYIKDNDIIELVQGKPERMYVIKAIKKNHRLHGDRNSHDMPTALDRDVSNEEQAKHQAIEDAPDVQRLQHTYQNLFQENERLRNDNQSLDRLQLAYDGVRHAYEKQRTENQTLLREIERLHNQTIPNEVGNFSEKLGAELFN